MGLKVRLFDRSKAPAYSAVEGNTPSATTRRRQPASGRNGSIDHFRS
jgi:hypothetical protein